MAPFDFDEVIQRYHRGLGEFMTGDPEPAVSTYSRRDDVTLGNPFGPFARGWTQVMDAAARAASNYKSGRAIRFDLIAKFATPDLAYIVEVEHYEAKVGGRDEFAQLALRATSIFRPEDGTWKLIHRHADPITVARPAESVIPA